MNGNPAETIRKTKDHDILKLAVCSDLRKNILICLSGGKRPLSHVRESLNISSTTAIHALRELEKNKLAFQDKDKNYALTSIGSTITLKLFDFNNAAEVLKKHEKFWLEHDLGGIPEHMMEKIGWLKDSVIIKNTETDIFKVHSNFINLLRNAKEIRGFSPFFIPDFTSLIQELILEKNIDIQLLLTREVEEKLDKKILKTLLDDKNYKLKLYILEQNVKVAFTVTDYFLSIGFFHIDEGYDYSNDLISQSKDAIKWGKELYEHYVKLSERVVV